MTETEAKRRAALRDGQPYPLCQICGKLADDPAHILPKSRFPSLRADVRNIVWLCRKHHIEHEAYKGRCELLELLRDRHGYEYPEEAFQRYLRMGDGAGAY